MTEALPDGFFVFKTLFFNLIVVYCTYNVLRFNFCINKCNFAIPNFLSENAYTTVLKSIQITLKMSIQAIFGQPVIWTLGYLDSRKPV